jgi:hypothetical protein
MHLLSTSQSVTKRRNVSCDKVRRLRSTKHKLAPSVTYVLLHVILKQFSSYALQFKTPAENLVYSALSGTSHNSFYLLHSGDEPLQDESVTASLLTRALLTDNIPKSFTTHHGDE